MGAGLGERGGSYGRGGVPGGVFVSWRFLRRPGVRAPAFADCWVGA